MDGLTDEYKSIYSCQWLKGHSNVNSVVIWKMVYIDSPLRDILFMNYLLKLTM